MKVLMQAIFEAFIILFFIVVSFIAVLIISRLHERQTRIKKRQQRRQIQRHRELKQHENEYQFRMIKRIWTLEQQKGNRQTVTIKGCFATEAGSEVMKASVSI